MSEKQKQALANICAIANQIPEEEQEKLASYAEGYAAGYNAGNCTEAEKLDAEHEKEEV